MYVASNCTSSTPTDAQIQIGSMLEPETQASIAALEEMGIDASSIKTQIDARALVASLPSIFERPPPSDQASLEEVLDFVLTLNPVTPTTATSTEDAAFVLARALAARSLVLKRIKIERLTRIAMFDTEAAMLSALRDYILENDPDIICGYNSNYFDVSPPFAREWVPRLTPSPDSLRPSPRPAFRRRVRYWTRAWERTATNDFAQLFEPDR
jgi:hypothetical protein